MRVTISIALMAAIALALVAPGGPANYCVSGNGGGQQVNGTATVNADGTGQMTTVPFGTDFTKHCIEWVLQGTRLVPVCITKIFDGGPNGTPPGTHIIDMTWVQNGNGCFQGQGTWAAGTPGAGMPAGNLKYTPKP